MRKVVTSLIATIALVATTAFGALALAAPASAQTYPPELRKEFIKSCVKSSRQERKVVSKRKATRSCKTLLRCLEANLTLEEFIKAASKGRRAVKKHPVLRKCGRRARSML